jgi:hypothetical protein
MYRRKCVAGGIERLLACWIGWLYKRGIHAKRDFGSLTNAALMDLEVLEELARLSMERLEFTRCDAGENEVAIAVEPRVPTEAAPMSMCDHMQSQTQSYDAR